MNAEIALRDTHPALAEMLDDLRREVIADENLGGEAFVARLMENILSASSIDEIFAAQDSGLTAGKEFTNRPFIVRSNADIEWRMADSKYTDQGGFPFYVILHAEELDGTKVSIGCGGKTFVATVRALQNRGYFDLNGDAGQAFMIRGTESDGGEYLSLLPFKMPEPASGGKRK